MYNFFHSPALKGLYFTTTSFEGRATWVRKFLCDEKGIAVLSGPPWKKKHISHDAAVIARNARPAHTKNRLLLSKSYMCQMGQD